MLYVFIVFTIKLSPHRSERGSGHCYVPETTTENTGWNWAVGLSLGKSRNHRSSNVFFLYISLGRTEIFYQVITGFCSLQLPSYIESVMHTVCLIWTHSEYYCRPARIIVILQEICNLFIDMVFYVHDVSGSHLLYVILCVSFWNKSPTCIVSDQKLFESRWCDERLARRNRWSTTDCQNKYSCFGIPQRKLWQVQDENGQILHCSK